MLSKGWSATLSSARRSMKRADNSFDVVVCCPPCQNNAIFDPFCGTGGFLNVGDMTGVIAGMSLCSP